MDIKRTKKMLEYFQTFQFTDALAFGKLLNIEENEDFEEYVTDILTAYNDQDRIKRKQLLTLARDVSKANKDLAAGGMRAQ